MPKQSNLILIISYPNEILPGVTSVDVVDPYTVRLNCPKYDNLILYNIASNYNCYMYSPTALQKNGVDWAIMHPVGTGPFKLKGEYERGGTMKLVRNPDYWAKGLPYLDGMEIEAVAEEISKIAAFKAGKANVLYDSPTWNGSRAARCRIYCSCCRRIDHVHDFRY